MAPERLMLHSETFPQEYSGTAKGCNGAAPYPVRAMRSRNPGLHLKPAASSTSGDDILLRTAAQVRVEPRS